MNLLLLVVDIASMSKPDDDHQQHVVMDRVDDPVVTDPDAKTGTTLERAGTWWAWILTKQRDRALDPAADLRVEFTERANSGRPQLDAVGAHSQPRSFFTCSQGMFGPSSANASS